MRFTDIEGRDTEDEYTLKGRENLCLFFSHSVSLQSLHLHRFLLLLLLLCVMTRRVGLLMTMRANSFPYHPAPSICLCAPLCLSGLVCLTVHTVFLPIKWHGKPILSMEEDLRGFHVRYRNNGEKKKNAPNTHNNPGFPEWANYLNV